MADFFDKKSIETQREILAKFYPNGTLMHGKNITETNIFKFIKGCAPELSRVDNMMNAIAFNHFIPQTVSLIEEWEGAVGIPDSCFSNNGTLEERRANVVLKLANMNVQTLADFVNMGVLLGFADIEVYPLRDRAFPPYEVPFIPQSAPESRFIFVVEATNAVPNVPPYDVPFIPGDGSGSLLQCVFNKLKPANTTIIFLNKNPI